ncbi:phthiotriol/phenolphthiotriol dimycocerosates methyltransferase 1 domain protein [Mycobacterium kansasii 662]|nr:phthiotriol/phenolphthiotriol dimycocerosates methyltransferase 1 domain protein [Mycobacterium kansasii 662]KEP43011.1 hypothetical protein MKSMC1_18790 [Mycobacterium kansasii]
MPGRLPEQAASGGLADGVRRPATGRTSGSGSSVGCGVPAVGSLIVLVCHTACPCPSVPPTACLPASGVPRSTSEFGGSGIR